MVILTIMPPLSECQCSVNGTVPEICDTLMGACFCIPNVTGQNCSECVAGLYGNPVKGIECRPCECPGSGESLSPTCILDSDGLPTCDNCATGYAGRRCEICADGYFRNSQVHKNLIKTSKARVSRFLVSLLGTMYYLSMQWKCGPKPWSYL